jgi:transcriptional antiterminator NusG
MSDNKKWYCLRVISGKERKIKERMDFDILREGWGNIITQTVVPTSKVFKVRNGKKITIDQVLIPGYVLVEALEGKLNGDIIASITGIQNVMHFLGKTNPIPMTEIEANRMLGKADESHESGDVIAEAFRIGETVKIIDGAFKDFTGTVQEVSDERKKLKVIVKIFGRGTEVELGYMEVEKVEI